jgi:hypothetical protein
MQVCAFDGADISDGSEGPGFDWPGPLSPGGKFGRLLGTQGSSTLATEFEHAEEGFFGLGAEVFGHGDLGGQV